MIDQALEEGKKVLLCVRDVPVDERNPWTAQEILMNLSKELQDLVEVGKLQIIKIPNISLKFCEILLSPIVIFFSCPLG